MVDGLQSFVFSAEELRNEGFPESFVEDYLNLAENFRILATRFQAVKSGQQLTTGAYAPLTGWNLDIEGGNLLLDSLSGEITHQNSGVYQFFVWVMGENSGGNNRIQLDIKIQIDKLDGAGFVDVPFAMDSQYILRNATQNRGSAQINGCLIDVSTGQKTRIMVKDIGQVAAIQDDYARITIGRKA